MFFLHENNSEHRDLKPANILLDEYYYPHISDFGISKILSDGENKKQTLRDSTPAYTAPEILNNDDHYTIKVDVYSFGIILFETITNSIPFQEQNDNSIIANVTKGKRPQFPENVPIPPSLKNLIQRCWDGNAKNRPSFETIYKSLAFNIKDLMKDRGECDYYLPGVNKRKV